jgi:hypothetical protein
MPPHGSPQHRSFEFLGASTTGVEIGDDTTGGAFVFSVAVLRSSDLGVLVRARRSMV